MTDLTALTIAEARDGLAGQALLRGRARPRLLAAIEAARGLNAYVAETPEKALAMAAAVRRAASPRGEARAARRRAARHQGPVLHRGRRTTQAGSHILDGFKPAYEITVTAKLWADGAVMLGKLNMDEFAMGSSNETSLLRPRRQSLARARGANAPLDARRLVRRLGRGGGGATSALGGDGDRHRRLDPPAGRLHRHRRHQADLRPLLALGHRRLRLVARPGRADRPRRSRDAAIMLRAMAGARPEGHRPPPTCRCPTFEAALGKRREGPAASASPRNTASTACRAEIEALWEQGIAWLQRRRRRDRRHLAAAHQVRAAGLLHHRARPRPRRTSPATTACATACACRRRRRHRACTRTPAPRASAPRSSAAS